MFPIDTKCDNHNIYYIRFVYQKLDDVTNDVNIMTGPVST